MADLPPSAETGPARGSPPPMPLWVKVFGLIALVLIAAFILLHAAGNAPFGHHGAHGTGA